MSFLSFVEISAAWLPFVEAIAKATLILGLASLVAFSLRGASAAARHLIWTSALLASLALPVASALLPDWQVAVLNVAAPAAPAAAVVDTPFTLAQNDHGVVSAPAMSSPIARTRAESTGLITSLADAGWPTWIALTWAAGSILILGHLLVGIGAVHSLARRTEVATAAPWLALAQALAADLGIRRVEFRRGGASTMPMTWGVMRPVVLMPADADTWPEERLRIVLLHELAHVKRADCLTHLLAQTACAAYWINPLTWIAARRARAERERACDDLVLACGTPGPDYAAQLLEIARVMRAGRLSTFAASASLAMAHRSQLEGRLMAILDPSVARSSMSRLRAVAAGTAALLIVAPLATIEPWVQVEAAVIPAQAVVPPPPPPAPAPIPTPAAAPAPAPAPLPSMRQSLPPIQASNTVQDAIAVALETLPETISAAIDGALQATSTAKGAAPDPKVVAALMEAMKDSDREVRESAMHALVRMRHPAMFEPLVQALKDSSADIRESAAFGLGQLRDKRAAEPLKAALKDSSASVREQAVFALGQLRDASAFDGLVLAARDESASVREQAVFALGQLRDPKAVDPLVVALRDASGSVREQAAFALGQLGAKTAVDALMAALKESDVDVREQAAFALGRIGDPRAVDALTLALKDSSAKVRQQVAFALGQLIR